MPIESMNGFEPTWLLLNQIILMLAENCLEKISEGILGNLNLKLYLQSLI